MKNILLHELQQDNGDGLLRTFFKSEMPDPWPQAIVTTPPGSVQRSGMWAHGRLTLVASITLMLISYVTLAALFPEQPAPGLYLDRSHSIGSKPGPKKRVPTASGGEALIWDERMPVMPGERPKIRVYSVETKAP